MTKKFPVVVLCGSTKLKEEFHRVAKEFTLAGTIVLLPNCYSQADGIELPENKKNMLIQMHCQMIDMADEVVVLMKDGHIGESTSIEIEYSKIMKKKITFKEV